VPPKLNAMHKAFVARIVEEGPIPAIHGVVRWRACDLNMRLHEEFGLSVSDDTIYRALKKLDFSHVLFGPGAMSWVLARKPAVFTTVKNSDFMCGRYNFLFGHILDSQLLG
jgi:hypothetical protein